MLILVFVFVPASVLVFILDIFLRRNNTLGGDLVEFEKALALALALVLVFIFLFTLALVLLCGCFVLVHALVQTRE